MQVILLFYIPNLKFQIPNSKMSYNEKAAEKVKEIILSSQEIVNLEEKKMFGGLCFMVNDKMCIGVEKDRLMVRLDPEKYDKALSKEGCSPMDFTGKPMKGFVYVDTEVLKTKKQFQYWVDLALEFNKVAKSSKKKKKNPAKQSRKPKA